MIHLTFDQDWAPAWATRAVLDIVTQANCKATFFVTHDCPSLSDLRTSGRFELAWHPNFLPGSSHGDTIEEVLAYLAQIVPEAQGARAHTLIRGTPFLQAYGARGLHYDAADLHDGIHGLSVFQSWTGLLRIPIFFEDDVHLQRGLPLDAAALELERPGLKVLSFHPVLLALNAVELGSYEALKANLSARGIGLTEASPDDFAPYLPKAGPGVRDLLTVVAPRCRGGFLREITVS